MRLYGGGDLTLRERSGGLDFDISCFVEKNAQDNHVMKEEKLFVGHFVGLRLTPLLELTRGSRARTSFSMSRRTV